MQQGQGRSGAQSIERAMAILDCFAGRADLNVSQVAARTGLPLSTTYRIMRALVRGGYLAPRPDDAYGVGRHVGDLVWQPAVGEDVAPYLYALATRIGITSCFGISHGSQLVNLVTARPPSRYCSAQIPDGREPLHATAMGKAVLAFDPGGPAAGARSLSVLDAFTSRTRITHGDLVADLRRVRREGFGVSDEERTEGVRGIAVPVLDADNVALGAIGVQARTKRMDDELVRSILPAMRHVAAAVAARLAVGPPVAGT